MMAVIKGMAAMRVRSHKTVYRRDSTCRHIMINVGENSVSYQYQYIQSLRKEERESHVRGVDNDTGRLDRDVEVQEN